LEGGDIGLLVVYHHSPKDTDKGRAFFLAKRAGTAFRNLFEGTKFQKSKNKLIN
jgi:hypothetical protein